jgi:hypothetical protein
MASIIRPGFENNLVFKRSESDTRPIYAFLLDELPSVTKGPISTEKAKCAFHFKPYDLDQALRETIEFYNRSYKIFPKMRSLIEKDIRCGILKSISDKEKFKHFIETICN